MTSNIDPIIHIDEELCTGCRRCAAVCPVDAIIGEAGTPQRIDAHRCVVCGQCVQTCAAYAAEGEPSLTSRAEKLRQRGQLSSVREPLFAAYSTGHALELKEALADPKRYKVVQCAPVIRVSLAEEFGLPFGTLTPGKMAAALRLLNFDRVYDTNFGADVTIMEEGSELIGRVMSGERLPMFTSCCPAWVKHAETAAPHVLEHLSSCKSPMQMVGALAKTYSAELDGVAPADILSVAGMPCTCKKFEAGRDEMNVDGLREVDRVITTRELAQLIKDKGIDFMNLPDEPFDSPLGKYSGAGTIFGATGGVMEAAIRTGYELITHESIPNLQLDFIRGDEGIRTATVQIGDLELKVAVVAGLKYVSSILEQVSEGTCPYHFIEVMACPEGCVSGGGQPKLLLETQRKAAYQARKSSIYRHDSNQKVRKSHENPAIIKLYKDFLGEPLGHTSHHLLHTKFFSRSVKGELK
ncbi:[FeFe] hydrogenase, group A [Paenibacillus zanthoxyli]|nr:[FeFe] hydrogenase, group A [Paenibacillus zanthoxyli]